jgi:hypothetical protein
MKLWGWIRSAVEFVKTPAPPRKTGPGPDVPVAIDSRRAEQDAGPVGTETRPEILISVEPESRVNVEPESRISVDPESRVRVEPESRISLEPESRISVEPESPVSAEPETSPSQEEIDRRRGIVRKFFNDYWSSIDDKPASFAERLDGAEGYINERVAAGGEAWRLSPATRKQLGLPPSRKR